MSTYLERVWKTLLSESYTVIVILTTSENSEEAKNSVYVLFEKLMPHVDTKLGKRYHFALDDTGYGSSVAWRIGPVDSYESAQKIKRVVDGYIIDNKPTHMEFSSTIQ